MNFQSENSDDAVLKELGNRIARYRLNRNQTQEALAQEAGVSERTVIRIEQGHSTQLTNLIRIVRALHMIENFETLIPTPAISPIQQMKMEGKKRKRASSISGRKKTNAPWSWGDEG